MCVRLHACMHVCTHESVCVCAQRIRLPSGGLLSHVPLSADIRGFALRAVACVHERDNVCARAICTRPRTRAACGAAGVASAAHLAFYHLLAGSVCTRDMHTHTRRKAPHLPSRILPATGSLCVGDIGCVGSRLELHT